MITFKIIFTILITYNISQIVSESTFPLFKYLRRLESSKFAPISLLGELLSCFLCSSVWAGCIGSLLIFDVGSYLQITEASWFWSGLFYSACAWFLHCIEVRLL